MGSLVPFFLMYLGGILTALPASADFLLPGLIPLTLVVCGVALYRRAPSRWFGGWVLFALLYGYGLLAPIPSLPANHISRHLQENLPAEAVGKIVEAPIVFPDRTRYLVELVSIQYAETSVAVSGLARINNFAP